MYRSYGKITKTIIYGDSISTGAFGGGYGKLLKAALDIPVLINHAVSGGISYGTPDNLVSLLENQSNIRSDADLIIVWHGTNDWYWGVKADSQESGLSVYRYGLEHCIRFLQQNEPNAQILCPTPLYRYQESYGRSEAGDAYVTPN